MTSPRSARARSKSFGVGATPTFFINGKKMLTAPSIEEFDKAFASAVKS